MKKALAACIMLLLSISLSVHAETSTVSIRELRESMPKRWDCEITTNDGETIFFNAPVNIPEVESFPVMLCETQTDVDHFDFQEGSNKDLYGKTDAYVRPNIFNPAEFPETDVSIDDVICFVKQKLDSEGIKNVDVIPFRYNALGPLCKTKSQRWTSPDGKVSFPIIVADPESPWKGDDTHGWKCSLTQKINDIPVFLSGDIASYNSVISDATNGYTRFINENLYMLWMCTVQPTETISPDAELLSRDALFDILKERARNGQLQIVEEVNLGYYCIDKQTAQHLDVAPDQDFEYMLLPIWQIRGYDTIIDPILSAVIPDLPFEEDVRFDPSAKYILALDARTGEVINYYPDN